MRAVTPEMGGAVLTDDGSVAVNAQYIPQEKDDQIMLNEIQVLTNI